MRVAGVLVLCLVACLPIARGYAEPEEPTAQFRALMKEYQESKDAKAMAPKFLEFARKNSKAPETVEALAWIMINAGHLPEANNAANIIASDHAKKPAVAKFIQQGIIPSPFPSAEKLLRVMIDKAEGNENKAQAIYNLGSHLLKKADSLKMLKELDASKLPDLEKRYGAKMIKQLRETDLEAVAKEGERQLDTVITKFAEVKKVAELAEAELFVIRHLAVGKMAPEIDGEDIDGKKFKLSDYKGKVVLLDFWGHWCPHCIAMVPHEIEMVKKLENKPFALIGVNSGDADREDVKKKNEELKISWRSFFDGQDQKIAGKWKVEGFPTLYLMDHKGVIREKFVGRPKEKALEEAVEKLVAEAEKDKK